MGKKQFCFFQTAETGNRTLNSGVKGSGANHHPRAPAHVDEGDYSSIIIMQDDGIHANLRYTQQAYVATVMKVTHALLCNFPIVDVLFLNNHIFCIPRTYM